MVDSSTHSQLLEIEDLSVRFNADGRTVQAVNDFSLSVARGEVVGIVGESGSGKTAVAQTVCGLIPSPPATISGRVMFDRKEGRVDILKQRGPVLRAIRGGQIGMIFQEPLRSLHPMYTAGWQVSEGIRQHQKLKSQEARERSIELLGRVGLPNPSSAFDTYPHQLSGGMRQRVMIAIALASQPDLLIADEPTTALDVTIQAQILDLLRSLKEQEGMAVMLITHDLGIVADLADRVAVMYLGELVEVGSVAQVLSAPQHPYALGLLQTTPRLSTEPKTRLATLKGNIPEAGQLRSGCVFAGRCPHTAEVCKEKPPLVRRGTSVAKCWMLTDRWAS